MRGRTHSLTVAMIAALAGPLAATELAQSPPPRDNARPADRAGTGVIRGRVVTADRDATPVHNARVSVGDGKVAEPVFTDGAGRFAIVALPAGRYQLVAEKTGFARTRYGAANDLDPPMPIDVLDGGIVDGIEITMTKGAAIVGRIVDELGEPVIGARVAAAMARIVGSDARLAPETRAAETDDRGIYRVGDLPPGRYYVSVNGAAEGARISGAPEEWARTSGWARTFYPGAPGFAAAAPIVLAAGEERSAIDFTLVQTRPAKLTLSLADASGAPVKGMINLLLPDETGATILDNRGVPIGVGAKMTPTLPPGEWVATVLDGGKALAHVRLSSGDEASLTLTVGTGARISGHVTFEGSSALSSPSNIRIGVRGAGLDRAAVPQGLSNGPATVKPDGSFEITGVVGTIQIAPGPSVRWTMRSAKYGERDLLDDSLTLSGNEDIRDVQIVFTDQLAEVAGTVNDANGRAAPGCAVGLFPDAAGAALSRRATLVRANQNGRVSIPALLPGAYLAVAASNIDAALWLSEDYLDRVRPIATRVVLADREMKSLTLSCVTVP